MVKNQLFIANPEKGFNLEQIKFKLSTYGKPEGLWTSPIRRKTF